MTLDELVIANSMELWKIAEDHVKATVRLHVFRRTGNWGKAEDDMNWCVRQEAYRWTGNWTKAFQDNDEEIREWAERMIELKVETMSLKELYKEDSLIFWKKAEENKDPYVRIEAYRRTRNWKKAEDDKNPFIKIQAFRHTGNWLKAKSDEEYLIYQYASTQIELNKKREELDKLYKAIKICKKKEVQK